MTTEEGIRDNIDLGRGDPAFSFLRKLPQYAAAALRVEPMIKVVADAAARNKAKKVYLVGGALRNALLGRPFSCDFDFVIDSGVKGFACGVALATGGSAFLLDKVGGSYRVVVKRGARVYTIDISPISGGEIVSDIMRRDFTINALAVPLALLFSPRAVIIDPSGGLRDLKSRLLRMVSKDAFAADALRCLRATRLSLQYGLKIDKETSKAIRDSAHLLEETPVERVRVELAMIFLSAETSRGIKSLYELGTIRLVLPEIAGRNGPGGDRLPPRAFSTLDEAESLLGNITEENYPGISDRLRAHFNKRSGAYARTVVFKLAAFMVDVCAPAVDGSAARYADCSRLAGRMLVRLKFGRSMAKEAPLLLGMLQRVDMFAAIERPAACSRAHFFMTAGEDTALDALFLALAAARAGMGGEKNGIETVVREMLVFYFSVYLKKKPAPILDGDEVMRIFGVSTGKAVGEILEMVDAGVESGRVRTKQGAIRLVTARLKGKI